MVISPSFKKTEILKSGKVNIKIRISHKGDSRFIATKFYILPKQLSELGRVINHPNAKFLNIEIQQTCLDYERKLMTLNYENWHVNRIVEILTNKQDINNFLDYFSKFVADKKDINQRTGEIYQATLTKIDKYEKRKPILFDDITPGWLSKFENEMKTSGMMTNAIAIHFRNIRAIFNSAIDNEIISQNCYPFRRFKIKSAQTTKRSLTIEQLKMIRDYETSIPLIQDAKDIFILSFYLIGINTTDLYHSIKIVNERVEYKRDKTHRNYSIKIEPEAAMLIDKIRGKNTVLNLSDRFSKVIRMSQQVNRGLNKIIPGVTMYAARHSWATIAANYCNASEEDIAAALGHLKNTVTSIYINRDQMIIDRLNRKVLDCLI